MKPIHVNILFEIGCTSIGCTNLSIRLYDLGLVLTLQNTKFTKFAVSACGYYTAIFSKGRTHRKRNYYCNRNTRVSSRVRLITWSLLQELLRQCMELVESTLNDNLVNMTSSPITTDSSDVTTGSGSLNKFDSSSGRYVRATDDGDRGDGNTPTDVCDVMLWKTLPLK